MCTYRQGGTEDLRAWASDRTSARYHEVGLRCLVQSPHGGTAPPSECILTVLAVPPAPFTEELTTHLSPFIHPTQQPLITAHHFTGRNLRLPGIAPVTRYRDLHLPAQTVIQSVASHVIRVRRRVILFPALCLLAHVSQFAPDCYPLQWIRKTSLDSRIPSRIALRLSTTLARVVIMVSLLRRLRRVCLVERQYRN